jgi:hypothetical protein
MRASGHTTVTSASAARSEDMLSSRPLLTSAALAAALIAPAAAHGAEGFTGVTSTGQVATFQSDAIPGITHFAKLTGLAAGEQVVALDRAPGDVVLGLTSAGAIVTLDPASGKATQKYGAPVTAAVDPASAVTFAVAPDGATARIVTGDRDVTVALATGVATPTAPALAFAPGDANAGTAPGAAVDYGADGRLVGVAAARGAFIAETAPASGALTTLAATPFATNAPVRTTVGSDGTVYTVADLRSRVTKAAPQSRMVRFDPKTGRISGQNGTFLGVRLNAIAANGTVPDDTIKPTATISGRTLHRHTARGYSYFTGVVLKLSEGGQTTSTIRLGHRTVGFGLLSKTAAGSAQLEVVPRRGTGAALRSAAAHHRKVLIHLTVHDWAGNQRSYDRAVSLAG